MDNGFDRLVPTEYRKIAQNDSATGVPVAAVYFSKPANCYYLQAQKILADGSYSTITLGPLPAHVFESLAHILADVHGMERRYMYLE